MSCRVQRKLERVLEGMVGENRCQLAVADTGARNAEWEMHVRKVTSRKALVTLSHPSCIETVFS